MWDFFYLKFTDYFRYSTRLIYCSCRCRSRKWSFSRRSLSLRRLWSTLVAHAICGLWQAIGREGKRKRGFEALLRVSVQFYGKWIHEQHYARVSCVSCMHNLCDTVREEVVFALGICFLRYVTISRYGRIVGKGWLTKMRAVIIIGLIYFVVTTFYLPSFFFQRVIVLVFLLKKGSLCFRSLKSLIYARRQRIHVIGAMCLTSTMSLTLFTTTARLCIIWRLWTIIWACWCLSFCLVRLFVPWGMN